MRRLLTIALMSGLGACAAQAGQAKYPQTYNDPLVFGMTKEDVARLIDALAHIRLCRELGEARQYAADAVAWGQ